MNELACECLDHILPTCPYHSALRVGLIGVGDEHRRFPGWPAWQSGVEEITVVDEDARKMGETKQFSTGAQRSADAESLDFVSIHPIALIALARTCAEGAAKYGHHNYERGMPATDALNHVLRHICLWLAGDRSEPHLPHAMWGVMTAIAMDTLHPELDDARRRGAGCTVTPGMLSALKAEDPERRRRREAGDFDHAGEWRLSEVPEVARILAQRAESETADPHPG